MLEGSVTRGNEGILPAITPRNGAVVFGCKDLHETGMGLCSLAIQRRIVPTLENIGAAPGLRWEDPLTDEEKDRHRRELCETLHEKNCCYTW